MATKTKTVGKTTNTIQKGGTALSKEAIVTKLLMAHNNYQEYRKTTGQAYAFATKADTTDFINNLDKAELEVLIKTYEYQQQMQYRLSNYIQSERAKNRAYGTDLTHYSELEQILEPTKRERLIQAEETQKKATKKTNKAITKALKEEAKEGGDA